MMKIRECGDIKMNKLEDANVDKAFEFKTVYIYQFLFTDGTYQFYSDNSLQDCFWKFNQFYANELNSGKKVIQAINLISKKEYLKK